MMTTTLITTMIKDNIMTQKVYPDPDEHENKHQLLVGGSHRVTKTLKPSGMSATCLHFIEIQDKCLSTPIVRSVL